MLYWMIDTPWLIGAIIVFIILVFLCLFGSLGLRIKIYLENCRVLNNTREETIRRKEEKIKLYREIKNTFSAFLILFLAMLLYLLHIKKEYQVVEQFYVNEVYNENANNSINDIFDKNEREYISEIDWAYSAVHIDWYTERFESENQGIVAEDIEQYFTNVENIYQKVPYKDDLYIDIKNMKAESDDESDDESILDAKKTEYDIIYETFNNAVNADISNWKSEALWEAYNAGKELTKINNTSEMVFQTGVLAEGAHENVYKESRGNDNTLLYLAGATENFEEFSDFFVRDSGNGVIISDVKICFRQAKMDYREGLKEKENESPLAKHFLLKSYGELQYVTEHTLLEDEMYLTYLYYRGMTSLQLISYIDDYELRVTLCSDEKDIWDEFLEYHDGDIEGIKVENKTKDEILYVYNMLAEYAN